MTDATLHERTVQKVAADAVNLPKRKRSRGTRRVTQSYTVKVDGRVMKVARRLAAGDMSRVEIRSETEVVVR